MPQEIRKFSKTGITLLQTLEKQYNEAVTQALMNMAEDMGLDPQQGWQVDARNGQFVRDVPPAPPSVQPKEPQHEGAPS